LQCRGMHCKDKLKQLLICKDKVTDKLVKQGTALMKTYDEISSHDLKVLGLETKLRNLKDSRRLLVVVQGKQESDKNKTKEDLLSLIRKQEDYQDWLETNIQCHRSLMLKTMTASRHSPRYRYIQQGPNMNVTIISKAPMRPQQRHQRRTSSGHNQSLYATANVDMDSISTETETDEDDDNDELVLGVTISNEKSLWG